MNRIVHATGWAFAIITLAVLARVGSVDREAAHPLLMVMPSLALVAITGGTCSRATGNA